MLALRVLFTVALSIDLPDIDSMCLGLDGDGILCVLRGVANGLQTLLAGVVSEKRKAYTSKDESRYGLLVAAKSHLREVYLPIVISKIV